MERLAFKTSTLARAPPDRIESFQSQDPREAVRETRSSSIGSFRYGGFRTPSIRHSCVRSNLATGRGDALQPLTVDDRPQSGEFQAIQPRRLSNSRNGLLRFAIRLRARLAETHAGYRRLGCPSVYFAARALTTERRGIDAEGLCGIFERGRLRQNTYEQLTLRIFAARSSSRCR
jgi:hypothetical protein